MGLLKLNREWGEYLVVNKGAHQASNRPLAVFADKVSPPRKSKNDTYM